ncbi:nucleic acid-binding, OB-fold, replication protein A, OB domain protein [Tanacetum coccineum]|uniref:Nucleic acid-binding, OB-fold, replication protein A, OB domain protein n=1 Tax=Tanacetum coccineum TaxID=301880 RepID=A0ABQ5DK61_9ASTR
MDLNTYVKQCEDNSSDDWKIKVRVIRLWKLPDFKNPLVTYSLEMVLMDEEGCKIHASVKKTLVSEFDSKLEQGQCYYLSDFGVTERKAKHHVVAHKYRINFYHITKVDNCDDIGGSLFGFDFRPFESVRSEVQPSTVAYDVIGQVVSCGSLDYPLIEGRPVKQLRFELQDTMGVRLSITLWGPYAEQVDEALGDRTKLSILIMQFAKHKIYRRKPSLSNLYNCTRFFINEDIPEIINFKKSVVAIVGTETLEHPIAPLVMSCVIVGTIKCVERETKWYYLGCRACNFGVDPKTEEYKDEESGLVKKKTIGYICKNKSCGEVSDVLYKFKIQIRVLVPTLEATVSSSLTPSLGFISPPSRLKYQDSASETGDTSSLIESLKDTGTSPIKRKLEDVIDVEELSNASSTKKKPLAPKIEKD